VVIYFNFDQELCEEKQATCSCETCFEIFCSKCFEDKHKFKKYESHKKIEFSKEIISEEPQKKKKKISSFQLYGFGKNKKGQLGMKESLFSKPTGIPFFNDLVIKDIHCGKEFTFVLTGLTIFLSNLNR
jgi:alpha-tubulin suppressor-like RCC1 family protein